MKHLLRVIDIRHYSKDGGLIWQKAETPNVIHADGEFYCLSALFATLVTSIPSNYYAGLDNRGVPARGDTLANLSQEPSQYGYVRQPINSGAGFVISEKSGVFYATSNVITFIANGGTWGPVKNIFLSTSLNNGGRLISTAALDGQHYLNNGEQLTMRLALSLRDIPPVTEDGE